MTVDRHHGERVESAPDASDEVHWTHRLFVENADLYLPFLEKLREQRAAVETDTLACLFGELGVPSGGRVLDLACGIGRHSIPLARRGYDVTGVDLAPLFVEKARTYAAEAGVEARFLAADALDIAPMMAGEPSYDAIMVMYTSHGYHGREGDVRLFEQLRTLAAPGAPLVVDAIHRDWLILNMRQGVMQEAGNVRVMERNSLDLESSCTENTWVFYEVQGRDLRFRLALEFSLRVYSLHELKRLLEETGWTYERSHGRTSPTDPGLVDLTVDSRRMWVVARQKE